MAHCDNCGWRVEGLVDYKVPKETLRVCPPCLDIARAAEQSFKRVEACYDCWHKCGDVMLYGYRMCGLFHRPVPPDGWCDQYLRHSGPGMEITFETPEAVR